MRKVGKKVKLLKPREAPPRSASPLAVTPRDLTPDGVGMKKGGKRKK